jgi:hypothetical protein
LVKARNSELSIWQGEEIANNSSISKEIMIFKHLIYSNEKT